MATLSRSAPQVAGFRLWHWYAPVLRRAQSQSSMATATSNWAPWPWVDGRPTHANPQHGNGVNLNALGFADPTRPEKDNVWIDWVSGAVVRQGLPVKVKKV